VTSGLRPRESAPPEVVALVVSLATELLAKRAQRAAPSSAPWRFSGRWFSAHPYSEARRPGR
jgi:hypothetical protein